MRTDIAGLGRFQRRFYRNELRTARAAVLADAEAFAAPLNVIERLGKFLNPRSGSLYSSSSALGQLAADSALAFEASVLWPSYHRRFDRLFTSLVAARNDAMHVGSRARHLTTLAVDACLILEDALTRPLDKISDLMVSDVVTVARWQPVSLLRHRILELSFTYVPVEPADGVGDWRLVADHQLLRFLDEKSASRHERLLMSVQQALDSGLESTRAELIPSEADLVTAREKLGDHPLLVEDGGRVIGIVTAFDLL